MFAGIKRWLRKLLGQSPGQVVVRLRSKYDAAQTNDDNRRHWSAADSFSSGVANSEDVRKKLRDRCRYEVANNSYARGIVDTLANDVVGTGPRLQMQSGNKEADRFVEREFADWLQAIGLPDTLRLFRVVRAQDGEPFARAFSDDRLPTPVKLSLLPFECDRVRSPWAYQEPDNYLDGIFFDSFRRPIAYHVAQEHPGDGVFGFSAGQFDIVPADEVFHWFKRDRPEQVRGIPDLTPALPLFAQLRRYTLAVISAAETAACFAGILKTTGGADVETAAGEAFETIEIERNMLTTAPAGWGMEQMKAEQPTTTYGEFKKEILNEIARCLNIPFNIAACNSSSYNYSSGRLDHQVYYRNIRIEQYELQRLVLDRLLAMWLIEAMLIDGYLPAVIRELYGLPAHAWFWDGADHVDPQKEALAQETRLKNGTTTLALEYAKQGKDWEPNIRQRGAEVALCNELGLSQESPPKSAPQQQSEGRPEEDGAEGEPEEDQQKEDE